MDEHGHRRACRKQPWSFWAVGLLSLLWLALRSGAAPRRLTYPCQRAAAGTGVAFLAYLVSALGVVRLYRLLERRTTLGRVGLVGLTVLLVFSLAGSDVRTGSAAGDRAVDPPGWLGSAAISDVFVVPGVPVPECSLDGGVLPATAPCNVASYALKDAGVDSLVVEMEARGDFFYETVAHPSGVVGGDDVVVIKINNQWAQHGYADGLGRLATNTDVLKGVIWRILQHPSGFTGEVVVAENIQQSGAGGWDTTPANSQDREQSIKDVVDAFANLGYPVSIFDWDDLNWSLINGGPVGGGGYPSGEYATGNMSDAYILLEDPAGNGSYELGYPKFRTVAGTYVSMRYGVWSGGSYHPDRLTFINLPVLKAHGMAGATIAWKNLIGFITTFEADTRFPGADPWYQMHDYFYGELDGPNQGYGLLGRQMALVCAPDLNIVDAIWVADDNYWGNAVRQDIILASTDPFALDWYASEFILLPSMPDPVWDTWVSAARAGTFRDATRTNQNSCALTWPGASYPWVDLLDGYDGDVPSDAEKNQMNVFVVGGGIFADGFEAGDTGAWDLTVP